MKQLKSASGLREAIQRADSFTVKTATDDLVQERIKEEPVEQEIILANFQSGKRRNDDSDICSPLKIAKVETIPRTHFYQRPINSLPSTSTKQLKIIGSPTASQNVQGSRSRRVSSAKKKHLSTTLKVGYPPTSTYSSGVQQNPPTCHIVTSSLRQNFIKPLLPSPPENIRDPRLAQTIKLNTSESRNGTIKISATDAKSPTPLSHAIAAPSASIFPPHMQIAKVRVATPTHTGRQNPNPAIIEMSRTVFQLNDKLSQLASELSIEKSTIASLKLQVSYKTRECKNYLDKEKLLQAKVEELSSNKIETAHDKRDMMKKIVDLSGTIKTLKEANDDYVVKNTNLRKKIAVLESSQQAERMESLNKNRIMNSLRSAVVELKTEKQRKAEACDHPPDLCSLFHPGVKTN